jgi:opacity protein-like surface antigen
MTRAFRPWPEHAASLKLARMRLNFISIASVLSILVVHASARADEEKPKSDAPKESGFEGGARIGGGVPLGKLAGDAQDISEAVPGAIPLWLDLGYRVNRNIFVGGYFQYAFLLTKNCPSGTSCSGSDVRFGAQAHYHFAPDGIDPWVGAGIGYEIFSVSQSAGTQSVSATASGMEFVNLMMGVDFKVSDAVHLGPFASLSINETMSESASIESTSASSGDFQKSLHYWLWGGLRLAINP